MTERSTTAALATGIAFVPMVAIARERMPYEPYSWWWLVASAVLGLAGIALILVGITVIWRRFDNAFPYEGGLSNLVWVLVAAVGVGFLFFAWGLLP